MPGTSPDLPRWYVRSISRHDGHMVSYASTRFADGSVIDADDVARMDLSGDELRWEADFDAGNRRLLSVQVRSGPPMWFVEDDVDMGADQPGMAMIAYATHHFPAGMVISNDEFEGMPVTNEEQIGAIRWWVGNGQIHEIYVSPQHRRRGVGGALIHAAAAYQMIAGRSPIWSSGERTDLGEAFARSVGGRWRVAARTQHVPPMTPEDHLDGIPARNLYPDDGSTGAPLQ